MRTLLSFTNFNPCLERFLKLGHMCHCQNRGEIRGDRINRRNQAIALSSEELKITRCWLIEQLTQETQ